MSRISFANLHLSCFLACLNITLYGTYLVTSMSYVILSFTVFRIRDILARIRILGSVHCITNPDPDPDPALFGSGFQDSNFFLTVGTLTFMVYFNFLLVDWRRIRNLTLFLYSVLSVLCLLLSSLCSMVSIFSLWSLSLSIGYFVLSSLSLCILCSLFSFSLYFLYPYSVLFLSLYFVLCSLSLSRTLYSYSFLFPSLYFVLCSLLSILCTLFSFSARYSLFTFT
jgi:hypothetical protein